MPASFACSGSRRVAGRRTSSPRSPAIAACFGAGSGSPGALMPGGKLPREETELVILRVAHNTRCEYEWGHHERLGKRAGLGVEEIERVRSGPAAEGWSERQALFLRAADATHADGLGDDRAAPAHRPAADDRRQPGRADQRPRVLRAADDRGRAGRSCRQRPPPRASSACPGTPPTAPASSACAAAPRFCASTCVGIASASAWSARVGCERKMNDVLVRTAQGS